MSNSFQRHPLFYTDAPNSFPADSPNLAPRQLKDVLGVQSRMFPTALPAIAALDHAHDRRAGRGVSGDYFDCFEMPEGGLGLAIGEVIGEAMPAALMTPVLHSLVRGIGMDRDRPPVDVIAKVSETFSRICPEGCLATLFIADVDAARGRLRYVNAGHEPSLVIRASLNTSASRKRSLLLEATGPALGMRRSSRYHERSLLLSPGDILVALTDGICDSEMAGGQVWGRSNLLRVIQECDHLPARAIVEQIFTEIEATRSQEAQGDMTLWLGRLKREEQKYRHASDFVVTETPRTEEFAGSLMSAVA